MEKTSKEYLYDIQKCADLLSSELAKLLRKDPDLSPEHINELMQLGIRNLYDLSKYVGRRGHLEIL